MIKLPRRLLLISCGIMSLFILVIAKAADAPAAASDIVVHKDVEYAKVRDISLKLDLYLQPTSARPAPLLIWIHGGGWYLGGKEGEGDFFQEYAALGFSVASIDYRLCHVASFPAQIYDCKAAVRWLRAHAADYGYNPAIIVVGGTSAGGHLASLLGTTGDDPSMEGDEGTPGVSSRVQAVLDYFGPADLVKWAFGPAPDRSHYDMVGALLGGPPVETKQEFAKMASPVYHVSAKACPFFIVNGDQDTAVDVSQSIELNDALKKAGVDSTLYVVKGGGHGTNDHDAYLAGVQFLNRVLDLK